MQNRTRSHGGWGLGALLNGTSVICHFNPPLFIYVYSSLSQIYGGWGLYSTTEERQRACLSCSLL